MFSIPTSISSVSAVRAIAGSLLALATIAFIGRIWARQIQKTRYQADDWLMISAWLSFVALCACMLVSTKVHTLGYSPAQAAPFHPSLMISARLALTIEIAAALCLGLSKASALLFYKRVFCVHNIRSIFKTIIYIGVIALGCWTITYIVFPLALCGTHFDAYWNRPDFNKYCTTAHTFLTSQTASDLLFEVVVILIPIPKILQLQTSLRRRLALILIFLTGFLSLGAGLARSIILIRLAIYPVTDAAVAAYGNTAIYNMWILEAGAGIIAINMPSLWFLRMHMAPEKILQSLRSALSLSSLRSRRSSGSGRAKSDASVKFAESAPSAGQIVHVDVDSGVEDGEQVIHISPKHDVKVASYSTQSVEHV